jgi:hypothetical protein
VTLRTLSPLVWVIIILTVLFIISLNAWMVQAWRSGKTSSKKMKPSPPPQFSLRRPWQKEDEQWAELSKQVDQINQQDKQQK